MSAHLPYSMVGAALPVVLKDGSLSECENARAGSTKARFRVRLDDINQLGEDREKRIRCSRVQGSKGHQAKRNSYHHSRVERRKCT